MSEMGMFRQALRSRSMPLKRVVTCEAGQPVFAFKKKTTGQQQDAQLSLPEWNAHCHEGRVRDDDGKCHRSARSGFLGGVIRATPTGRNSPICYAVEGRDSNFRALMCRTLPKLGMVAARRSFGWVSVSALAVCEEGPRHSGTAGCCCVEQASMIVAISDVTF